MWYNWMNVQQPPNSRNDHHHRYTMKKQQLYEVNADYYVQLICYPKNKQTHRTLLPNRLSYIVKRRIPEHQENIVCEVFVLLFFYGWYKYYFCLHNFWQLGVIVLRPRIPHKPLCSGLFSLYLFTLYTYWHLRVRRAARISCTHTHIPAHNRFSGSKGFAAKIYTPTSPLNGHHHNLSVTRFSIIAHHHRRRARGTFLISEPLEKLI